jgi:glucose-6-phosphate 1-epimerase
VRRDDFKGSWAGAFGMTQFMPGTFARFMNDGAGTPAADIVHSVPDALATTARYLRGLGWTAGQAWGVEVKVPPALASANALEGDHACLQEAVLAGKCSKLAQWAAASVRRIDGAPLLAHDGGSGAWQATTPTALLMPAGPQGPAWLVTPNYQAIWRYNRADAYALAIGLLSDALRGGPPQRVAWPTDDPGLSRAEFREVQAGLLARGHCELRIDGAQGPRTSTAIREEEQRIGWPQTGRAGARLLAHLRSEHPGAVACPAPAAASAAASSVANMHQPSAAGAAK